VEDEIGVEVGWRGGREAASELPGGRFTLGIRIHDQDLGSGDAGHQTRRRQADYPGAHHRDAVTRARGTVPNTGERRLHVRGQHGTPRRNVSRKRDDRPSRNDVPVLMGVKTKDDGADQALGFFADAGLHHTHAGVSVLHRPRKVALLERTPHGLFELHRNVATKDEAFGAA
jgi:hypothetical protein